VQPDIGQLFDYTWHDTTQGDGGVPSSVTLNFTGTAVYLFSVVPNTIPFATTLVNLQFTLDGNPIGTYTHVPDSSSDILYSVPVLSSENLNNTPHTLVAETSSNSLFIFDFAMYTFDDSPIASSTTATKTAATTPIGSSQTSSIPVPTQSIASRAHIPLVAIVAGTVSGVIAITLSLITILCWKRMRRTWDESGDNILIGQPVPALVSPITHHSAESGHSASNISMVGSGHSDLNSSMVQVGSTPLLVPTSIYSPGGSTFLPPYAPTDPYPSASEDSLEPSTVHTTPTKI